MQFDLLIKNGIGLFSHPEQPYKLVEESTNIGIIEGKIAHIGSLGKHSADKTFDAKNLHILPGLIDTQVHFREPGMTHKETIESGSKSALLGGITAFFEMPNTRPPTVTKKDLENKINIASKRSWCDFAFFVGATPDNISDLPELVKHPHCPGVKIFMGSSTGSLLLNETKKLEQILKTVSKKITVHSEDENRLRERKHLAFSEPHTAHQHPIWRDVETALISTKKIVRLAQKYKRQVHVLHITTKEEIEFLSQHKEFATVEVTPQHLSLFAPDCYDKLGTLAQMNPPIRDKKHHSALWEGIHHNIVSMIGSDHAPHTLEEKQKEYPHSPSGMPGVQTLLPLMLNHVNERSLSLKKLTELLALNPHRYYKIKNQGLLRKNFKANITIVDLKQKRKILKKWLASKCAWSPFENKIVTGWPIAVLLKGKWAMREDELVSQPQGAAVAFLP